MALRGVEYKISKQIALVLMVLMLVFIARLFPIKAALLLLLLLLCDKKPIVVKPVRLLCFWGCLSTLWGIIIGVLKGTEDPLQYLFLGMIWPILSLFVLLPLLYTEDSFRKLFHYIFYIHAFLIIYDIGFALSIIYGFPYYNLYPEIEVGFSFYETSSRLNFANLNVLTYTIPIYFLVFLSNYDIEINKILQAVVVVLSFVLLILCGRRSLMGLFVYAPLMAMLFRKQLPKDMSNNVKYVGLFFIMTIVFFLFYIYYNSQDIFEGYLHQFTKAFDAYEEPIKFKQAVFLFNKFLDNPILGSGSGKFFYDPYRHYYSESYEIVYLLILATRGIIGFIPYLIGKIGPLVVGLIYAKKEQDALFIFMLISYSYILMAEMTNPIMNGFDLILPLLFNYAKINSLVLMRRKLEIHPQKK